MIRPTVARVDLSGNQAQPATPSRSSCVLRMRSDPRFRVWRPRPPGDHRGRQGERLRAWRAQVALALEEAGAAMLACADIEEAIVLREAGVRAPILVFGALSVSDLDGVFSHGLTPTISTPVAARALQEAAAQHGVTLRCHLKIDTGMNRLGFRHDNLRRTLPERRRQPQPVDRRRLHALRHRRRSRPSALRRAARAVRVRPDGARVAGHRHLRPPRRQQRRAAARRARLVRLRPARAAALRRGAAAARRHARSATCPVTPQPYRGGEGPPAR